MKKKKKLLLLTILIIIGIFTIYKTFYKESIYYVALGDSLTEGINSYGERGYGYPDFIADEFKSNNKLKYYTKKYSESGYKISDIMKELTNSELKKDLRESSLVTISIGANDFLSRINKNTLNINEIKKYKSIIQEIIPGIDNCIKELTKYAKEEVIIVGYYNPIPFLFNISEKDLDALFSYIDDEYTKIARKYNVTYISNYQLFKKNTDYLPNPNDIHPNIEGYQAIASNILNSINNK